MMIGGGGSRCAYADNGIGITETDKASLLKRGAVKVNMTLVIMLIQEVLIHPWPTH